MTAPVQGLGPADALRKSDTAFFEGNRIGTRWRKRDCFVILELGFGAGFRFLSAWSAWRGCHERPQRLHYLAVAPAPHAIEALETLHAGLSRHGDLAQELRAAWPMTTPGWHRLFFDGGRVVLTLVFADAPPALQQMRAGVDAFHIDDASCNGPGAWQKKDFSRVAQLAAPEATLTLAPASSQLQCGLENVGFVFSSDATADAPQLQCASFLPQRKTPRLADAPVARKAIVIGAGLAGSAACERLAARGWHVALIERHAQPAQETSANMAGIFMPTLSKDDNLSSRLTRAAFLFALHQWQGAGAIGTAFPGATCGVLQLARDAGHARVQREIAAAWRYPERFAQWLEAPEAASLLGGASEVGGWLFPQGGWADPAGLCKAMLAACGGRLETHYARNAAALTRTDAGWQVRDEQGDLIAGAPTVIFASGAHAPALQHVAHLPLTPVRGQVSHFPSACMPQTRLVLCREGYLTPPVRGVSSVGASYEQDDDDRSLRDDSHAGNLQRLAGILPNAAAALAHQPISGRVGFRSVAPDRLPLAGALPDLDALRGFRGDRLKDVPRVPGLHCLLGYASRGLIWAPLAAELLACRLSQEPLPIEGDLADAIDPARFALKGLRKQ